MLDADVGAAAVVELTVVDDDVGAADLKEKKRENESRDSCQLSGPQFFSVAGPS